MIPFHAVLSINAFVVSLFMAHYVTRNSTDAVSRLFGLLCLGVAALAFAEFQLRTAGSEEAAAFWVRFMDGYPLVATLFLLFAIEHSEHRWLLGARWAGPLLVAVSFLLTAVELAAGGLVGGPVEVSWGWTYRRGDDPLLGLALGTWLVSVLLLSLLLCWRHYRRSGGDQREQAKYVLVGLAIPATILVALEGLWPLAFGRVPEIALASFTFSGFFIAYGISRHELFRITPTTAAERITENMSDILFLVDAEGRVVKSNRAARRFLGAREAALKDRPVADLFEGIEGRDRPEDWGRELLRGKGPAAFEATLRGAGDKPVTMWFTASRIRDDMGEVRGTVLLGRDISERKRALERERKYFHDLALLSQTAMECVDLTPDDDIYEFLGELVGSRVRDGYTFVLSYDAAADEVEVRAAFGVDDELRKALETLGGDLVGLRFPVRDSLRPSTAGSHVRRLEGSLRELLGGRFPEAALADVETALRIGGIFQVPIVTRGELLGIVVIAIRRRDLGDSDLIEAIVNQASVAVGRKLALDALMESERKYSMVVEKGNDGIVLIQEDMVRFMNARAMTMTGAAEGSRDRPFLDFVAPEHRDMQMDRDARRARGEVVPSQYEIEVLSSGGGRIPVEVNASAIEWGGQPAMLAILRDISDRRRAEAAVRASEERYRTLVEQIHDGVYIHTGKGFAFVNHRVVELTGYSESALMGMRMDDLLHPADREIVMQISRERERGLPTPSTYSARLVRKDGKTRHCEFSVSVIPHGDGRAELGSIRDVSLRRQIEEELKEHAKALERSNRELEQFAYVASHDLQEPLRMVASYVQLLEKRYRDRLDKDANEFIEYAVDGAKRMQVLINDLLQYSRVHTRGKEFQPTEMEDVLAKSLANLKVATEEAGATVTHDPLPRVMGDPGQMLQLLQNLIGNAVKFHGKEPPVIHVGAARRERDWLMSVRDNGIGIDPQYRDRIFVIFQRLHKREEYPGTGIGLAVCKRIVERHDGEIWVESTLGQGATFYFTIPIRGGEGARTEAEG